MTVDKSAAKAILRDPQGNVLVLRRSASHPHVPFTSDLPGGTFEADEQSIDALIREVREEIGLDVGSMKVVLIDSRVVEAYGKRVQTDFYEVTGFQEQPKVILDSEHDKFEWLPVRELTHVGFFEDQVREYVAKDT